MECRILAVNAGSTSFKFKLFDGNTEEVCAYGQFEDIFSDNPKLFYQDEMIFAESINGYADCARLMLKLLCGNSGVLKSAAEISGIGFKTVMAGELNRNTIVDASVIDKMREYMNVAPAHNKPYIEIMKCLKEALPNTPQVAVFETGFHNTIPKYAYTYPINKSIADKFGIRKYGFHGASHSYAAHVTTRLGLGCVISCHLGGSSSICAIKDGVSIDVSMGFSPQSGLPMNNRCGDIDIFAVLYLMQKTGCGTEDMIKLLSSESGLWGMSQTSADMRELLFSNNEDCKTAAEVYLYSILKYIGSYVAVLGGVDAITFSGGIGENSAEIRRRLAERLSYLGLSISERQNEMKSDEIRIISEQDSNVKMLVIPADEEFMVARKTAEVLKKEGENVSEK